MLKVEIYSPGHRQPWEEFVGRSKNATFLFNRDYLEYHADRFTDASLLVFKDDALVALFPASVREGIVSSHGGLTYGGVLSDRRMSARLMLEVFDAIREHYRAQSVAKIVYKAIPHIYHAVPAEEDLYALFRNDARLIRRDVSSTVATADRPPVTKGRKWTIKQARGNNLEVARSDDFHAFMAMEEELLRTKYGTKPVHSGDEIKKLSERFPDNIKLFTAKRSGELLGGIIVYETPLVAHAQYISSTEAGRELRALDAIFDHLLGEHYASKRYFDFGISTESAGRTLNEGLVDNKESWGARTTVYDFYEMALAT